jgi:maltose O-acetyltransferase
MITRLHALYTQHPQRGQRLRKIAVYLVLQRQNLHLRATLGQILVRCLPQGVFGTLRAAIYRTVGFRGIGAKVMFHGPIELQGQGRLYPRLSIGAYSYLNSHCFIDLNGPVHIGRRVTIGHHTVIVTSNHELGPPLRRAGALVPAGVTIGDGAWIAARVTILPGVTIGPGAVVGAGSVVTKDVPANCKVAGVPAKIIGYLDSADATASSSTQ